MAAYENAGKSDDWYTPKYIFEALGLHFNTDVASPSDGPRYVPCDNWISSGSLDKSWRGLIWMNPPFGHQSTKRLWLRKFIQHGDGVALVPDRTSAPWFQEAAPLMDAICFVSPKIKFERPDGSCGQSPGTGTALLAIGEQSMAALLGCGLGMVVRPRIAA
jgi:hypothetical protein